MTWMIEEERRGLEGGCRLDDGSSGLVTIEHYSDSTVDTLGRVGHDAHRTDHLMSMIEP